MNSTDKGFQLLLNYLEIRVLNEPSYFRPYGLSSAPAGLKTIYIPGRLVFQNWKICIYLILLKFLIDCDIIIWCIGLRGL